MLFRSDMPSIVSTTKVETADIRIVGTLGLGFDQCNIFLARTDAPKFATAKDALKWLDGKQVAVPKGSCTDRFAQATFKKENVQPKDYLNQNIEVITSNFRAGKIDAAVIWEPTASRLVQEGLARRVASGSSVNEADGGFLAMRADLIKLRPDVVIGYFHHIPFPAYGIYSQLPWRRQVLEGLLGADVIGFQRVQDAGNFAQAASLQIPYFGLDGKPTAFYRIRYLEPLPGFAGLIAKLPCTPSSHV